MDQNLEELLRQENVAEISAVLSAMSATEIASLLIALHKRGNEITAIAIHHLKAPLISHVMSLDFAHKEDPDNETVANLLDSAKRIYRGVKASLAFERIDSSYKPSPSNLNALVTLTARFLTPEKGIYTIICNTKSSRKVNADYDLIEKLLGIFFENALDSMPAGGTIEIGTQDYDCPGFKGSHYEIPSGPKVNLYVKDSGFGIIEAHFPRILEPRYTTKQIGRGNGLGLAIADKIAKVHGGQIDVESEPGKGATFSVYFPSI